MTVNLEEKLLFKLLQWAGVGQSSQLIAADVESEMTNLLSYRTVIPTGSRNESLQLYFEFLNVASTELRISVSTTSQLPDDLRAIKHHLGFPLIKFESPVKLKGYDRSYMLGDVSVYADSLMKHYKKVGFVMFIWVATLWLLQQVYGPARVIIFLAIEKMKCLEYRQVYTRIYTILM